MTDTFRALCAELLNALENAIRVIHHEDGTQHISTADAVIAKAAAALAQPEPVGVTDEDERFLLWKTPSDEQLDDLQQKTERVFSEYRHRHFARAVLARWGRPAITPIPVSERLPGDQLCWWLEADEDGGYGSNWTLLRIRGSATGYTHWLPAHALPLPTTTT
jgi:hypothetical protein